MNFHNWRTQLRKGLLEMAVINLLQNGKIHGYEMVQKLKQLKGLKIREGNIYAILVRLRIDGVVKSREGSAENGPPRNFFELTKKGWIVLEQMNKEWQAVKKGLDTVMNKAIR